MFSNLIFRNSRRSRKENGLFFSSLVISIIAFYMILSISTQDVMIFLQKMESNAVNRLLLLIPVFYGMTLGILFFLIYFACKYQFERRRHEFGVYLMLGMRRSKLFWMLLAEDFLTSILAMLIGLPVAVVLSEIVSLVTAKLVVMGIIGHQFSLSWSAIEWTLAGFLAIKLTALLILSGRIRNAKNHGCAAVRFAARKYPMTANTGSTAPLPIPYKKALPRLPVAVFMGKDTAAPSGKFCIAMPTARPSAETNAPSSPSAAAAPNAKPTASPSGMLCMVTARKSFADLFKWLFNPSSSFVPL